MSNQHRHFVVDDASELALAGTLVAPPGIDEAWSEEVADWHAAWIADGGHPGEFSWERTHPGFPALRRRCASRPEDLECTAALGLRPFGTYLQATPALKIGASPITPDWGNEHLARWRELPWFVDGERVRVSTDELAFDSLQVDPLTTRAVTWGGNAWTSPVGLLRREPLVVHTALIQRVGRGGGRFRGDPVRQAYSDADLERLLVEASNAVGVEDSAKLAGISARTVERVRAGGKLRASTRQRVRDAGLDLAAVAVEGGRRCALPGCDRPVDSRRADYCSRVHKARAHRQRRGARRRARPDRKQKGR